jgi:hypothetical protein
VGKEEGREGGREGGREEWRKEGKERGTGEGGRKGGRKIVARELRGLARCHTQNSDCYFSLPFFSLHAL